jgi:hypothetical protein
MMADTKLTNHAKGDGVNPTAARPTLESPQASEYQRTRWQLKELDLLRQKHVSFPSLFLGGLDREKAVVVLLLNANMRRTFRERTHAAPGSAREQQTALERQKSWW